MEFDATIRCCDGIAECIYNAHQCGINQRASHGIQAELRKRSRRARASGRTRSEEKQLKKDEKTALRKARRAEMDPAPDDTNPPPDETQS